MGKALLVLDMQEAVVGTHHAAFFRYDSGLLQSVNAVIDRTDADYVVYIKNLMKKNLLSRLAPVRVFDGTPEAELAKELHIVSENIFSKYTGDAFSEPALCDFFQSRQIDTAELTGADGGGCVALTALGACRLGCRVILHTQAIGTMFVKKRDRYYEKLKKRSAVLL